VGIRFSESGIFVEAKGVEIQTAGIHGGSIRKLPKAEKGFKVRPRDVVPAIKQAVSVGTDEDDVKIEFTPMSINVSLEAADGGESVSEVVMPVGIMGEITLDPRYLEQAFRAFGLDEEVEIGYTNESSPFVISMYDGFYDLQYFLAPRVR